MEELCTGGQSLCMNSCSQVNDCGKDSPCRREITFAVHGVIEGCKVCKGPCTRPFYRALPLLRPLSTQYASTHGSARKIYHRDGGSIYFQVTLSFFSDGRTFGALRFRPVLSVTASDESVFGVNDEIFEHGCVYACGRSTR